MKITTKSIILAATVIGLGVSLAQAEDAQVLWDKQCAKCHGKDGKGQTAMGKKLALKDYTDAKVQADMKDEEMTKVIKEGVQKDGKTLMKAAEGVSDEEIKALVAHVRKFKP